MSDSMSISFSTDEHCTPALPGDGQPSLEGGGAISNAANRITKPPPPRQAASPSRAISAANTYKRTNSPSPKRLNLKNVKSSGYGTVKESQTKDQKENKENLVNSISSSGSSGVIKRKPSHESMINTG